MNVYLSRRTSDDAKPNEAVWTGKEWSADHQFPATVYPQRLLRLVFQGVEVKHGDYVNLENGDRYMVWKTDEFELGTAAWCIELSV